MNINPVIFIFLLSLTHVPKAVIGTVSLADFVSFGPNHGDQTEARNDDGSTPVLNLSISFGFFGVKHSQAWVNTNGAISFASVINTFTPSCTPVASNYQMVSPFWADVDTRYYLNSSIYYRQTTAPADLVKAQAEIHRVFPSASQTPLKWAFVATWYRVTFFGCQITGRTAADGPVPENTMQAVLAANEDHSFAIFYYNKVTWTAGTASGGNAVTGRGGSPARAGFDAGDGVHLYLIEGSCNESIVNLASLSNVNKPGVFVFQIDENHVVTPSDPPTMPTTEIESTTTPEHTTTSTTESTTPEPTSLTTTESTTEPTTLTSTESTTEPTTTESTTSVITTSIATPVVTTVAPVCSGHGSCVCDKGYDGADCSHAINFCAQPVDIIGYANYSEACEPHGHCVSVTPTGAECVCNQGWSGPFCEDHDNTRLVTERCYLRQPSSGQLPNVPVGCPNTPKGERQACVPDNLNCFLDQCSNPIGWCIPRTSSLDKFIAQLSQDCPNLKIPMPKLNDG